MDIILTKKRTPKCSIKSAGYAAFSVELSQQRLTKIQNLLDKSDCLLIICGIDSHFNAGCTELCNYLFFNMFQKRNADFVNTGFDDEVFDDIVICISKLHVSVYLNPINYWLILPYIAGWPGVEINCIPDTEFTDSEKVEIFKMETFFDMVKGYSRVFFPYFSFDQKQHKDFDKMLVEEWPLVQAYAAQEYGVGTFFTLKHEVNDISDKIHDVIASLDDVSIEHLLSKSLSSFKYQFNNIYDLIDMQSSSNESHVWNLKHLVEPLLSYQRHLQITHSDQHNKGPLTFVSFDTTSSHLKKLLSGEAMCDEGDIVPKHHVIIQAFDNVHGLGCTRSYVLSSTSQLDVSTSIELGLSAIVEKQPVCRFLSGKYELLVRAVHTFSSSYTGVVTIDKMLEELQIAVAGDLQVPTNNVKVSATVSSSHSGPISEKDGHLRFLSVYVFDLQFENNIVSSLAFGNTYFINSGKMSNLTSSIPISLSWGTLPMNIIEKNIEHKVGAQLLEASVFVVTPIAVTECDCYFYENHVILHHNRHGSSMIDIEQVFLYEGESVNESVYLKIPVRHADYVTRHLLCYEEKFVLLRLDPGTKIKLAFFSRILGKWKSSRLVKVVEKYDLEFDKGGLLVPSSSTAGDISTEDEDSFVKLDTEVQSVIVWGHFGSFADSVARGLVQKLPRTDNKMWQLVDLQLIDSTDKIGDKLSQLTDSSLYVILCPFFLTPRQVSQLARLRVLHIFVCVNSETVVRKDKCNFYPGVLDCLSENWCSALVLTTPQVDVEGSSLDTDAQIKRFYKLINSTNQIIRSPNGEINKISDYLPPDLQFRPGVEYPKIQQHIPQLYDFVKVEFKGPLDRARLTDRLSKFKLGQCVYLQGKAQMKLKSKNSTTFWHSAVSGKTGWGICGSDGGDQQFYVAFYGKDLNLESLRNFLRLCATPKPTKKPMLIPADLTNAVVERIHKLHKLDPLPPGWFFNGTKFISMDGESCQRHPDLNKFLQSFVDEQNAEIAKFNSELNVDAWQDLFA